MGFWSGLGKVLKVAAPIVLAATGVGLPAAAAISGGANMLGSKMQGKSWGGSMIDGLMGAGTGAAGSLMAGAGAARGAAGAAGSLTKGEMAKRVGGSLLTNLLNPDTMSDLGRGAGAIAATQARNRGTELEAMMEADQMDILGRRDRRDDESDLWKKLQAVNYMKSGGKAPSGPMKSSSGDLIPSFDFGPAPISDADKAMASTLEGQLLQRLGNAPKPRDYDSRMKPSGTETALNWLSPLLTTVGNARKRGQEAEAAAATRTPIPAVTSPRQWWEGMRPIMGGQPLPEADPESAWLTEGMSPRIGG